MRTSGTKHKLRSLNKEAGMTYRRGAIILLALLALLLLTAGAFVTSHPIEQQGQSVTAARQQLNLELLLRSAGLYSAEAPPPAELDTCQHCHLSGEITNMWVPAGRWAAFGLFGMVFLFGAWRSTNAWVNRKPLQPLSERALDWFDERLNIVEPMKKVLFKPVPKFATRWMYCLGGITFFLFVIQGVTGILLAMYYKPSPQEAYASIQFIENEVRFGAAIRAIHHWAANGMIVMVVAHMLRVFITGAFKAPREFNWVTGVVLLITTLGFGFTGYLLPWDQRAFWATTVGSGIAGGVPWFGDLALVFLRGGWNVTAVTLSRFYAIHVLVLPVLIVGLMVGHFIMIRRQGIARPL
jgi:hypothetical protein